VAVFPAPGSNGDGDWRENTVIVTSRSASGPDHSQTRSVLVVEDDTLLRELIALALERHGFTVDTAASASDAQRVFRNGDHDALVLDVSLGVGTNGFDLAEALRRISPHVAIVFLTNLPDPRFTDRGVDDVPAGVAYLRKSSLGNIDHLIQALDNTLRGQDVARYRQDRDPQRPLGKLTRKQLAVLGLAAAGMSNAQIAQARGVSVKAIEDTISRAAQALDIDSATEGNLRVAAVRRYLAVTHGDTPGVNGESH
jgi:DNA-binding NarL/FixJ family response regulator